MVIAAAVMAASCQKSNKDYKLASQLRQELNVEDYKLCPNCDMSVYWLPEGTKTDESVVCEDSTVKMLIKAPSGYQYLGYDENLKLLPIMQTREEPVITITCNCLVGKKNSCRPGAVLNPNNSTSIVCIMYEGCSQCERIESTPQDPGPYTKNSSETVNILTGGFVDMNKGVAFARKDDFLPYAFEAMLEYDDNMHELEMFLSNLGCHLGDTPEAVYSTGNRAFVAPDGYCFAVLDIFGRAAVVLLPQSAVRNGMLSGDLFACSCEDDDNCGMKQTNGVFFSLASMEIYEASVTDSKTGETYSYVHFVH